MRDNARVKWVPPSFRSGTAQKPNADFPYPPLDQSSNAIRLLIVYPREHIRFKVRCMLYNSTSRSRRRYCALSYAWGTAAEHHSILVNGKTFRVRANLFAFLQQFSLHITRPEQLWVDAICIDQNSVFERNHQVGMMRDVFAGAAVTFAWLGIFDKDQYLMSTLNRLTRPTSFVLLPGDTRRGHQFLEDCAYFQRLWVAQELVLAKQIEVRLGIRQNSGDIYRWPWIEWPALMNLCTMMTSACRDRPFWSIWRISTQRHADMEPTGTSQSNPVRSLAFTFRNQADDQGLGLGGNSTLQRGREEDTNRVSLGQLVMAFGQNQCSEKRDRIYGVLGMTRPAISFAIDYTEPPIHLFIRSLDCVKDRRMQVAEKLARALELDNELDHTCTVCKGCLLEVWFLNNCDSNRSRRPMVIGRTESHPVPEQFGWILNWQRSEMFETHNISPYNSNRNPMVAICPGASAMRSFRPQLTPVGDVLGAVQYWWGDHDDQESQR